MVTAYDLDVREVVIQLASRSSGMAPPMTIAPTSSLKHMEKTLGAWRPLTSLSMKVGPYCAELEKPTMPSAICEWNSPVSRVWQPKVASIAFSPWPDERWSLSCTM